MVMPGTATKLIPGKVLDNWDECPHLQTEIGQNGCISHIYNRNAGMKETLFSFLQGLKQEEQMAIHKGLTWFLGLTLSGMVSLSSRPCLALMRVSLSEETLLSSLLSIPCLDGDSAMAMPCWVLWDGCFLFIWFFVLAKRRMYIYELWDPLFFCRL